MVPQRGACHIRSLTHAWGETPTQAMGTYRERSIMAKGSRRQACTVP